MAFLLILESDPALASQFATEFRGRGHTVVLSGEAGSGCGAMAAPAMPFPEAPAVILVPDPMALALGRELEARLPGSILLAPGLPVGPGTLPWLSVESDLPDLIEAVGAVVDDLDLGITPADAWLYSHRN